MPAATSSRLAWPDVAKGLSILGVVALHVTLEVPGGQETLLAELNALIDPLRMPLFFLVSGLFSAKVCRQSLRELFCTRLWFFLVPYLVWVPLEISLKYIQYRVVFDTPPPTLLLLCRAVLSGSNLYWFLAALMLFNLVLWAVRALPRWVALGAGLLPWLWLLTPWPWPLADQTAMYLPIFLAAALFSQEIRTFALDILADPRKLVAGVACCVASMGVFALWDLWESHEPLAEALLQPGDWWTLTRGLGQMLMLPAGIMLVVALSKVPVLSEALQFLGRHTLPIYLAHPIALTLAYHLPMALLADFIVTPGAPEPWHATETWIIVCLGISLVGGLLFWVLQQIPVVGWPLRPPPIADLARWCRRLSGTEPGCRINLRDQAGEETSHHPARGRGSADSGIHPVRGRRI